MSVWVVVAGVLGGLGIFLVVRELIPAPARLDAALARLDSAPAPGRRTSVSLRLARHVSAELPWLPTPTADLALATAEVTGLLGEATSVAPRVLVGSAPPSPVGGIDGCPSRPIGDRGAGVW